MNQHVENVREFMKLAKQRLPEAPVVPDESTRRLRANLILEEALETIHALGFDLQAKRTVYVGMRLTDETIYLEPLYTPNLEEIADGCADLTVVTTGTALACGIDPEPIQQMVDESNLSKFQPPRCPDCVNEPLVYMKGYPGSYEEPPQQECYYCDSCGLDFMPEEVGGYTDYTGKWIKPNTWEAPEINEELKKQSS